MFLLNRNVIPVAVAFIVNPMQSFTISAISRAEAKRDNRRDLDIAEVKRSVGAGPIPNAAKVKKC